MEESIKEIISMADKFEKRIVTIPTHSIKRGLSVRHLHRFIKSQPADKLDNMANITRAIISTQDEDKRTELFFGIYRILFKKMPVHTVPDLLVFTQLISILALQKCRQPQPPLDLLRQLLFSIPDELHTQELMSRLAHTMILISTDPGDRTYLCMQCAYLGTDWTRLTEILSWLTLTDILHADKEHDKDPSIPELHKLISTYGSPKTVRALEMTVHLISILVNRLVSKDYSENVEQSLKWLKLWLAELPSRFNTIIEDINPEDLHTLMLETLITNISIQWPVVFGNSQ